MAKSDIEKLDIGQKIDDAIVTRVAIGLKENWTFIDSLFDKNNTTSPTDQQFADMAKQVVNSPKNEFMLDGTPRSLQDVKAKALQEFAGNKDIQKQMADLDVEVPTKEQRQKIAQAVEKGVEENTGMLSKLIYFLKGVMSWIAGFFNGENKEKGFWDHVNQAASKPISQAVNQNLQQLSKEEGFGDMLDPDNIKEMVGQVEQGVINKDKESVTPPSIVEILGRPEHETKSFDKQVIEGIRESVQETMNNEFVKGLDAGLAKKSAAGGIDGWKAYFADKVLYDKQIIKDVVEESVLSVVTNPDAAKFSQADLQREVAASVETALSKDKRTQEWSSMTPEAEKEIAESVAKQVAAKHGMITSALALLKDGKTASVAKTAPVAPPANLQTSIQQFKDGYRPQEDINASIPTPGSAIAPELVGQSIGIA